jgi:hypothetical protein
VLRSTTGQGKGKENTQKRGDRPGHKWVTCSREEKKRCEPADGLFKSCTDFAQEECDEEEV